MTLLEKLPEKIQALNRIWTVENKTLLWPFITGALQSASEQEKMKIMAVLNALRSPAFQAELGLTSSTGSSSPRDSDTGHHMASETGSLSGSMTGSEGHSQDLGMPPPPPPPSWSQSAYSSDSLGRDLDVSLNKFLFCHCCFFLQIFMSHYRPLALVLLLICKDES